MAQFYKINYLLDIVNKNVNIPSENNLRVGVVTSPPEGVARYCFHPVCLSVCLCVVFWEGRGGGNTP